MKRVAILGSTGSIGQSALAVAEAHPDRLRVVALAAGENVPKLVEQVARHRPDTIFGPRYQSSHRSARVRERPSPRVAAKV